MERIDKLVSRTVPWLTLFMVLVTFVIVLLRYVFARGWVWMQEIVLYMHAFVFLLAAAHTLARDAHVRVDILYRPLQPGKKALVNLLGAVFLLIPSCAVLLYQSIPFVLDSWQVLEGSKDGGGLEAVFVLKTAIPVFCLLLLAQAVSVIVRSLEVLRKPPP